MQSKWDITTGNLVPGSWFHLFASKEVIESSNHKFYIHVRDPRIEARNGISHNIIQTFGPKRFGYIGSIEHASSVALAPNDRFFVAGYWDGTAQVWNLRCYEQILEHLSEAIARRQGASGYLRFI